METRLDERLGLAEESFMWREVDGQVIVLDQRTWSYLAINDSGAELWKAIAAGATRVELIQQLCQTYELDEQTATRDVDSFISMMQEHGMLRSERGRESADASP